MNQESDTTAKDFANKVEEGGVQDISNPKASFFTLKTIIVIALAIVSLILGVVILSQTRSGGDVWDTTSANRSGSTKTPAKKLDRIFFSAPVFESDGEVTHRVVSILENGKDLRFYGKSEISMFMFPPVTDRNMEKIMFVSTHENEPKVMMQNLNQAEVEETPIYHKKCAFPAFNPTGDMIAILEAIDGQGTKMSLVLIEAASKNVLLKKEFENQIIGTKFSRDGNYIIYSMIEGENPGIYKMKLTKTGETYNFEDPELVSKGIKQMSFLLVSPTQDKLLKVEVSDPSQNIHHDISMVDMNDGTASPIAVSSKDDSNILIPLSWSENEEFVYMYKVNMPSMNIFSLLKMNVTTGNLSEILTFTALRKPHGAKELSQEQQHGNKANSDVIQLDGKRDRIFFSTKTKLLSVLEDGTNLCHHGELREGKEVREIISDKDSKKVVFKMPSRFGFGIEIFVQDWESTELSETPLFKDDNCENVTFIPKSKVLAIVSKKLRFTNVLIPKDEGKSLLNIIPSDINGISTRIRPQFSHDGKSLICYRSCFSEPTGFYEVPLDTKSAPKLLFENSRVVESFLVSPTDNRILVTISGNSLFLYDPKKAGEEAFKRIEFVAAAQESSFRPISWSSNGQFMYMDKNHYSSTNRALVKLEIETGKITTIYEIEEEN